MGNNTSNKPYHPSFDYYQSIKDNEALILAALQEDNSFYIESTHSRRTLVLKHTNERLLNNRRFMIKAVNIQGKSLQYASMRLRDDFEVVLNAVKNNGLALVFATARLQSNNTIMREAIKQNGRVLEWIEPCRVSSTEMALLAVGSNEDAMPFVHANLKNKRLFVLEAIKQNGLILKHLKGLNNDKKIVLASVRENGLALQYASDNLKNDKQVVLRAIQENDKAYEFASDALQGDIDVGLEMIRKDYANLEHVYYKQANKRLFIIRILQKLSTNSACFHNICHYLPREQFQCDKEIVLVAVKHCEHALAVVCKELQDDEQVVETAVKRNGCALCNTSARLKSDRNIVLQAIKNDGSAWRYASLELRREREMVLEAAKTCGTILSWIHHPSWKCDSTLNGDKQVVQAAVSNNGLMLQYAYRHLTDDKETVLMAVKQNGRALQYVSEYSDRLKKDKDVIREAYKTLSLHDLLSLLPFDFKYWERRFLIQLQLDKTQRLGRLVPGYGVGDLVIYCE
jgi:hypothetical protein